MELAEKCRRRSEQRRLSDDDTVTAADPDVHSCVTNSLEEETDKKF